jgi:uncharacterized protein YhaN
MNITKFQVVKSSSVRYFTKSAVLRSPFFRPPDDTSVREESKFAKEVAQIVAQRRRDAKAAANKSASKMKQSTMLNNVQKNWDTDVSQSEKKSMRQTINGSAIPKFPRHSLDYII